jgi:hypothetical protein
VPADDNINSFVRNDDASEFSSEAIYANKLLMIGLSYYYRIIVIYGCFHPLKYNIFYEVMPLQFYVNHMMESQGPKSGVGGILIALCQSLGCWHSYKETSFFISENFKY